MGQQDRAVRTEQVVEPAIGSAGLDDRAERRERADHFRDGLGVSAGDFHGFHDFTVVSNGRHDDELTMQIDTNVPHEQVSLFGGLWMDSTSQP